MTARRRGAAGFTLIEVLVVVAILGLALGLVGTRLLPRAVGLGAQRAAVETGDLLRLARAQAVGGNRPAIVRPVAAGFEIAGGRHLSLPPGVVVTAAPRAIVFAPDGSSSGGTLALSDGGRDWRIDVDWLTGRVRVARAR
jgi:general secretion pathway protein H